MCGIIGAWMFDGRSIPAQKIATMADSQAHRGPDGDGHYCNGPLMIGNQRLAIIDPEHGDQPFVSEDGATVVVQNGEIFNFVELASELAELGAAFRTHSDTEVLLHAYRYWGPEFVTRLNGMFAIAIWDAKDNVLRIYRDRIGIKPLFVHESGAGISFASEIKGLIAGGVAPALDPEALDLFLTFNYVPPPKTIFAGIAHLPPGCFGEIRQGEKMVVKRWWSLVDREQVERSEQSWTDEFLELFDDATRLRLRSDVAFGAFLSGGVDSTSVVGFMARHLTDPVKTFSIGFEDVRFDESRFAIMAAKRFNTDHTQEQVDPDMIDSWPHVIWHLDQPHGDVSFMPTYRVAQLAAKDVKMVLTGDGGDELFAGYDKHKDFFAQRPLDESEADFRSAYLQNISLFDNEEKKRLYRPEFAKALDVKRSAGVLAEQMDPVRHWDRLNQALNVDMQLLLPGNNLVKPDRMGMAVGLEARAPMLDYRMMEFAFSMPAKFKLRNGETKYLFKKAVAPMIGSELAYRKKQMFTVPIGEWLKTKLAAQARDLLLGEGVFVGTLFSTSTMTGYIDDHVAGKHNRTREIRALMAIEHWARAFLGAGAHAAAPK